VPERSVEGLLMGQSKITSRGQITLPKDLRDKFGLKQGDTLYFIEIDGSIVLRLGPIVLAE